MEEKGPDILRRVLIVWVVTMVVLLGYVLLGIGMSQLPEEESGARIIVDQVFFHSKDVDQETLDLEVYIYITNNGDRDCKVVISAYALDVRTNLVKDTASLDLGTVSGLSTLRGSLRVQLDRSKQYRVELVVQKEQMIAVKGSGTVNLKEAGSGGVDYKTDYESGPTDDEKKDSSIPIVDDMGRANAAPFLFICILLVPGIIVVIAIIYFVSRRRGRK
ncbi:MAG: hypothetical protein MUC62_01030 [Candidatus Thermoplasmatota archaeon]|jgi:hypothetical protein|nr:hypothetical protein [Candidatus Thermoplasmatota archaeon]